MSDPLDNATRQEEMNTDCSIQSSRPTPQDVDAFWRMLEEWEINSHNMEAKNEKQS